LYPRLYRDNSSFLKTRTATLIGSPRLRTQDPFRIFESRTRYLRQLPRDRRVLDLSIVHQQKRLTENYAQDAIALKRQGKIRRRIPGTLHDTQVATARLHQNVAASDVDAVEVQPWERDWSKEQFPVRGQIVEFVSRLESFAPDANRDGIDVIHYASDGTVMSLQLATGEKIDRPQSPSFLGVFFVPLLFPLVGFVLPWWGVNCLGRDRVHGV